MSGTKLVKIIQDAAKQPVYSATDMVLGKVTSVNPLTVKVDNRFEIGADFLLLTSLVRDFSVDTTVSWSTTTVSEHSHQVTGKKTMTVHLALTVGEDVLLLRVQGGQKFIIIDRLR